MAVPGFQEITLPLLRLAGDGKEHPIAEALERLADDMHLPPEDRRELLPSGRQRRFDNRVRWARKYLGAAKLLEATGRGRFRITARGRELLGENPSRIDLKLLMRYPEVREFRSSNGEAPGESDRGIAPPTDTPLEALEAGYQALRNELAKDLLEKARQASPQFFERLVVDLLVAMGYGGSRSEAGQAIGGSGDGGIDGLIRQDPLGLDVVYIQAKRWQDVVGRPVIQAFAGSLDGHRAQKGVFITTSRYSRDAEEYVRVIPKKIVLIDGDQLARLMMDHDVGVTPAERYVVKRLDLDYFDETE